MKLTCPKLLALLLVLIMCQETSAQDQRQSFPDRQSVNTPLSYGLLVDNSGSLRPYIEVVIAAAAYVIDGNRDEDETFILRFVDRDTIQRVQDFTKDKSALGEQLEGFYTESGTTAITDAVYNGAKYLIAEGREDAGRRALILVTDGYDRNNYYRLDEALGLARTGKVQIYIVALTELVGKESPQNYARAVAYLNRLATETGGRAYFPKTREELKWTVVELNREVRK